MNAPAIFLGLQPGINHLPPVELYNLLAPVGEHPAGSTVSRHTLERYGFRVPTTPPPATNWPAVSPTGVPPSPA